MTKHFAKPAPPGAPDAPNGHADPAGRPRRRRRRLRPRRSWGQRFVIFGGVLSALVLVGSAAGLGFLYEKLASIPRIELSSSLDEVAGGGEPRNYLIVGIDNDEGLAEDDPIRAGRDGQENTDTIMVLRIDPSSEKASILSFPRDLWVPYPDGSNHRINQAYVRGGRHPALLIEILNDYFGIPIHHYVQIDFAAFYSLVDAIGGVPVYFPYPAKDDNTGLTVFDTGCVTLDRNQAIGYVRSRFYEELRPDPEDPADTDWVLDQSGDLGRIQRQQNFIRRSLQRAIGVGARNPGTLNRLLDVAAESVTIDDELTPGDIYDLGQRFRSFEPEDLENFTVPTVGDRVGEAQILRMVESAAEPILSRFRDPSDSSDGEGESEGDGEDGSGEAPAIAPQSVRLTVLNGTGAPGQATETADALATVGFDVIGRRDAEGDDLGQASTIIRYPAGARPQAELLARWLGADAELVELGADVSAEQSAAGIELITGADWAGVRERPRSGSTTSSGEPPRTTVVEDGPSTSDGTSGTATSLPEELPSSTTTTPAPQPPC